MRVLVLYRPNSEHARLIDDFGREFQSRHYGFKLDKMNVDTRDGSALASLYDILQYPAILVLQDDGVLQQSWQGQQLPLIDEVLAYARV